MQGEKFLVVGKDKKMCACRDRIIAKGYECRCADETDFSEIVNNYKNIILPLPTVRDGYIAGTKISVDELASVVNENQTVFNGNAQQSFLPFKVCSYYRNDDFLRYNSRLTAQGTLRIILENCERDINELSAAVIGYGSCGKEICRVLQNNGISVTSFSRRTQTRLLAEKDGLLSENIESITEKIYGFDIIVNTVPANIIDESSLEKLNGNNLYIEIASKPFGFDISQVDRYAFRFVHAPGLPGKFTPTGAGKNIADTVLDIIKEGTHE